MEPVSVTVAAFVTAIATSAHIAKEEEKSTLRLPRVLATLDGPSHMRVLVVRVFRAEMAARFQDERFAIRVRYGARGRSLGCDAASFSPALPAVSRFVRQGTASAASSELGSTCLFLWSDSLEPVVRLKVRRVGIGRPSVAKAEVCISKANLANLHQRGVAEVPLRGGFAEEVGRVVVACEVLGMQRRDLARILAVAGAEQQSDAYVLSSAASAPTVAGDLVDQGSDSGEGSKVFVGMPVRRNWASFASWGARRLKK